MNQQLIREKLIQLLIFFIAISLNRLQTCPCLKPQYDFLVDFCLPMLSVEKRYEQQCCFLAFDYVKALYSIVLIVRYTCMCIIGWYQSSKVRKLSRRQWKLHYKLWAIDQELPLCILWRLLLGLHFHSLLAFWPVRKVIKTESIRKLYQNI